MGEQVEQAVTEAVAQNTKLWQSRFDTVRAEKQAAIERAEELERQLAAKAEDKTLEERKLQLAAELREQDLNRKVEVFKYAAEKGIDAEHAMKALGFTDATDAERLDLLKNYYDEGRKDQKNEYIMKNGRKIQESNTLLESPNYGGLMKMTDDKIKKLGGSVIDQAVEKEKEKHKRTLAQKLRGIK